MESKQDRELSKRGNALGFDPISHNKIHNILVEAGLNNPIEKPRKTRGKRRFVRKEPNELWQADFKLTDDDQWILCYRLASVIFLGKVR